MELSEVIDLVADGEVVAALLVLLAAYVEVMRRRDRKKAVTEADCLKRCGELKGRLCKLEPEPDEPDAE